MSREDIQPLRIVRSRYLADNKSRVTMIVPEEGRPEEEWAKITFTVSGDPLTQRRPAGVLLESVQDLIGDLQTARNVLLRRIQTGEF